MSDQKLFDALDKLAANHINICNLIIDDNWQSVEEHGEGQANRRWLEFDAEPKHFPRGLKGTVDHIREKHPYINHVAVWHALFGKDTSTFYSVCRRVPWTNRFLRVLGWDLYRG